MEEVILPTSEDSNQELNEADITEDDPGGDGDNEGSIGSVDEHCENSVICETSSRRGRKRKVNNVTFSASDNRDPDFDPEPRRSKRIASKPTTVRQNLQDLGLVKGEKLWKEAEKKQFLEACKEFGSKEVDLIAEKIPTKYHQVVKNLIDREKRNQNFTIETKYVETDGMEHILDDGEKPRRGPKTKPRTGIDLPDISPQGEIVEVLKRRKRNAPIEMWIDTMENTVSEVHQSADQSVSDKAADYSPLVPKLLQWIGDYEKHPDPEKCGGVDYASIYRYLSCLCQGEAPPDLNPESSIRVRKLFSTLCKTLNQLGLEKETKYLESFRGPHSVYPNNRNWDQTSDSAANMIKLSSLPGMNPLQLHPAMFTRKEIPKLDDLIKLTSEEIVDDGFQIESEVNTNLKPFN